MPFSDKLMFTFIMLSTMFISAALILSQMTNKKLITGVMLSCAIFSFFGICASIIFGIWNK